MRGRSVEVPVLVMVVLGVGVDDMVAGGRVQGWFSFYDSVSF